MSERRRYTRPGFPVLVFGMALLATGLVMAAASHR